MYLATERRADLEKELNASERENNDKVKESLDLSDKL